MNRSISPFITSVLQLFPHWYNPSPSGMDEIHSYGFGCPSFNHITSIWAISWARSWATIVLGFKDDGAFLCFAADFALGTAQPQWECEPHRSFTLLTFCLLYHQLR